MDFTYREYEYILDLLRHKGYSFTNYKDYNFVKNPVILRHDIDFSLEKALIFANLENAKNIKSTYFVLLSTNFYNVFSKESGDILKNIKEMGHDIGLHFDEKKYIINSERELEYWVKEEITYLSGVLRSPVNIVSMHRPSKWILDNDIHFDGLINTYSKTFISDFKYISDSRMHWREDVLDIIEKQLHKKLHILTHPFWYSEKVEKMKEKLLVFINNAKVERYNYLTNNLRGIDDIIDGVEL